jgi:hypothetical protein
VVSFTPWPLYTQRKSPLYPLDRKLGGPQSRSGRGRESNPDRPARSPALYRLSYHGSYETLHRASEMDGNESSGSIKGGESDKLSDSQLVN